MMTKSQARLYAFGLVAAAICVGTIASEVLRRNDLFLQATPYICGAVGAASLAALGVSVYARYKYKRNCCRQMNDPR